MKKRADGYNRAKGAPGFRTLEEIRKAEREPKVRRVPSTSMSPLEVDAEIQARAKEELEKLGFLRRAGISSQDLELAKKALRRIQGNE